MPELPEVETVSRSLRKPLTGRAFSAILVTWARTVDPLSPENFVRRLTQAQVESVGRRAKLIVMPLSTGDVLTTHLRMTGKLIYAPENAVEINEPDSHLRVSFELDSKARLDFFDARKFGRMRLMTADEWRQTSEALGPEPLEPEFTVECLATLLRKRNRQIKPLLLDQQVIAGIGNIYADEALYQARIHPMSLASSISARKLDTLHHAIVTILQQAINNSGTTLRDYRTGTGSTGTNIDNLRIYGAAPGARCQRCDTRLKRLVVGQRGTTICPRCQRLY